MQTGAAALAWLRFRSVVEVIAVAEVLVRRGRSASFKAVSEASEKCNKLTIHRSS
jgi:hypothetical protein